MSDLDFTVKAAKSAKSLCDEITTLAQNAANPFLAEFANELQVDALKLHTRLEKALGLLALSTYDTTSN